MKPVLLPALEAELAAIRRDPLSSVGLGDKSYVPYVPNVARSLINVDDPVVTARLLAEIHDAGDRVLRLALLHVMGRRHDATVDRALIDLLADRELRATAAYLLGAVDFKGHPKRARDEATRNAIRAALQPWLDDATPFEDPFTRTTHPSGDFVLGAFVRVTGPSTWKLGKLDPERIGLDLPEFDPATRSELLRQAAAIR